MGKRLIVIDVCDTLYKSNTTFDFIRFFAKKESRLRWLFMYLITNKWSPFFYLFALMDRFFDTDVTRKLSLKIFSGTTEAEIKDAAEKFYSEFLMDRRNEKVFDILRQKGAAAEMMLASSSIEPVVAVIARQNGFEYISSKLEVEQGKYTGRLSSDLTGRKHLLVSQIMGERGIKELLVITDNRSDRALVGMSNESYVIVNTERDKSFWKGLNTKFILGS